MPDRTRSAHRRTAATRADLEISKLRERQHGEPGPGDGCFLDGDEAPLVLAMSGVQPTCSRPTRMPNRANMAWTRGAPYVRRDRSQIAEIHSATAASVTAVLAAPGWCGNRTCRCEQQRTPNV
jgi:hypothetical protein